MNLTYKGLKDLGKPKKLKQWIIQSIVVDLDRTNDRIFFKHQYENRVSFAANSFLSLRKKIHLDKLYESIAVKPNQGEKIKWLRSTVEFGEMFRQLEIKGYYDVPTGLNAEPSYEKLAKILFSVFDVTNSWDSFKDALNPERNKIGKIKKAKLSDFPANIPEARDLGAMKKTLKKK